MRKRVAAVTVLTERDLAAVWANTSGTLALQGGGSVRVLYPGRRNPDAGPDFVDAVLETEGGEVRGAVELHRRTSDWTRHGHAADPRYAGVVLHVVGYDDGAAGRRPGGGTLPLLELAAAAEADAVGTGDLRFPCAVAVHAGRSLVPVLEAAGESRFRANVARLREALAAAADPLAREQVAYEALAEALGYSRNSQPLRTLAQAMPLQTIRRLEPPASATGERHSAARTEEHGPPTGVAGVEALFLGTAGLLPSQRHLRMGRRRDAYVEALERRWAEAQSAGRKPALRAYAWEMGRVRPENAPVRRAVALAHLFLRWPEQGMLAAVCDAFRSGPGSEPRAANRRLAALMALPCPPGYWAQHWDFGVPTKFRLSSSAFREGEALATRNPKPGTGVEGGDGDAAALVGPSRTADAVVNVLLPLAAALGGLEADALLAQAAAAAYAAHPLLAENWITRLVRERAALPHPGPIHTARAQQGLIAVYEGPCRDLRCRECPLPVLSDG